MKKHAIITASILAMILPTVFPSGNPFYSQVSAATSVQQSNLTLDQVIANINQKKPIPVYLEATHVFKEHGAISSTDTRKIWDNAVKGESRDETIVVANGKQEKYYAVTKGPQLITYKEGEKQAELYPNSYPPGMSALNSSQFNEAKSRLKMIKDDLQKTDPGVTNSVNITEEKMMDRPVYHVSKKQQAIIEGNTHLYFDDVWIDKQTGLVLKSIINNNNGSAISEYTVTKVNFQPTFPKKISN
ncbi:LolA family protein [Brevibacillus formosus]|uniref:LolA family protein n=1 Tax=Brevibacillus formosus TaxID=54913 RepID=UPI003F1E1702